MMMRAECACGWMIIHRLHRRRTPNRSLLRCRMDRAVALSSTFFYIPVLFFFLFTAKHARNLIGSCAHGRAERVPTIFVCALSSANAQRWASLLIDDDGSLSTPQERALATVNFLVLLHLIFFSFLSLVVAYPL